MVVFGCLGNVKTYCYFFIKFFFIKWVFLGILYKELNIICIYKTLYRKMAYYNKVINLNKVVVMSLKKSDLIKKKQHIEKHIKRSEIVISKRYVMAN
jgi:hypothetical protein